MSDETPTLGPMDRLRAAIPAARRALARAGTLHCGWDVLHDAEALLAGRPAIVTDPAHLAECLERYARQDVGGDETPTIPPALTPEEWASKTRLGSDPAILPMAWAKLCEFADENGVWNSLHLRGACGVVTVNRPDLHALAALCLHGQPFGPRPEWPRVLQNISRRDLEPAESEALDAVAAFIRALLPPEG